MLLDSKNTEDATGEKITNIRKSIPRSNSE